MEISATSEEIRSILGDTDDLVIERILETGAPADEVRAALAALEGEWRPEPSSAREAQLRAILQEVMEAEDEDERMYGSPA